MSKPLIFVLQLVGALLMFFGAASEPVDVTQIIIGAAMLIIGGVGFRKRLRMSQQVADHIQPAVDTDPVVDTAPVRPLISKLLIPLLVAFFLLPFLGVFLSLPLMTTSNLWLVVILLLVWSVFEEIRWRFKRR